MNEIYHEVMDMKSIYSRRDKLHEIFIPKSVITWIFLHITRPIRGFEHKRNVNGEYMSYGEQLSETHYQLMVIATDYFKRGASDQKIYSVLSAFKENSPYRC